MSIGGVGGSGGVDPSRYQSAASDASSSGTLHDKLTKAYNLVEKLLQNHTNVNMNDYYAALALLQTITKDPNISSSGSQTAQWANDALEKLGAGFQYGGFRATQLDPRDLNAALSDINNLLNSPLTQPQPTTSLSSSLTLDGQIDEAKKLINQLIQEGLQGNANVVTNKTYNETLAMLKAIMQNPQLKQYGDQVFNWAVDAFTTLDNQYYGDPRMNLTVKHATLEKIQSDIQNIYINLP